LDKLQLPKSSAADCRLQGRDYYRIVSLRSGEKQMNIHPNACTTPKIRAEIRASGLSRKQVMEKYNVGYTTSAKWLERDDFEDRTHQPHKLQTRLT
jgi:hypothetical protein